MKYNIPYEASLILNFFSGKIYFVFENEKEVESFLELISRHDSRFDKDFKRKSEMKSAAWEYRNILHMHHLEWSNKIDDFKKLDMYPVSYSVVMEYVNQFNIIADCCSGLMSAFCWNEESEKEGA